MVNVSPITINARFLTEQSTRIALNVAQQALATALDGIEGASLIREIGGGGGQLDLTLNAVSNEALAEALERAGPHIGLLSKSAHLMSLEVSGPVSDAIRAGLEPFFPVYHDDPAGG